MFRKKQPEDSTAPRPAAPGGKGLKSFFRRHWKPTAAVVCVAAAGAAILIPKVMAQPASAGVEYIEVEPELRSIVNVFSESGTIEAAETYEVRSLVRGDVLTSDFEEGDMVEKGTILYTIDSADDALSIPNAAVVRGGYVLVTEDSPSAANAADGMTAPDGYVYVKVETGVSDDNYIAITSGLQEGDTVAYDATAATISSTGSDGMMMPGGMGGMPSGGAPGGGMR